MTGMVQDRFQVKSMVDGLYWVIIDRVEKMVILASKKSYDSAKAVEVNLNKGLILPEALKGWQPIEHFRPPC